ncbi:MAG TPA: chloride channel protein [Kofleriaceae bacterium]|nr:chloride channel protein [Kofleriaceae bacterium]
MKELGDFTATRRMIPITGVAIGIGVLAAFVALALLRLIGLFTNLCFFQRWDTTLVAPAGHHLGPFVMLVPVAGGLIIGLMAKYGSEKIRGHGIPEALESILLRGSRVETKLAILKPLSAAISIGSGGPFGAEGPIIMTGGAFGSLVAQRFHLTAAERKTLLVAGSAAGMAATFGTPLAATLLAVELLLFEWKPRSFVPVALACASAMATRHFLFDSAPLFPVNAPVSGDDLAVLLGCIGAGLGAGVLSAAMTASVYFFEDRFLRLRMHWMWWPALGGLAIGIGGLIEPRALGVGYDVIGDLLHGHLALAVIVTLVLTKWAIWAVSLGSGTSGGVLAPLLMLGASLGALLVPIMPSAPTGFWQLIGMGAILGGTMRSPLTGILFAAEVSGDFNALLPLSVAVVVAHAFTVLTLRRSVLTEKVARRGFHITREYEIDPLEVLFVREVMRPEVTADTKGEVAFVQETLRTATLRMAKHGVIALRVVNEQSQPVGTIVLEDVLGARKRHLEEETRREALRPLPSWMPIPQWVPLVPPRERSRSLAVEERSRHDE